MRFKAYLATLLLAALPLHILSAQEIRNVSTEVVLNADGSADVTQEWDATVVSGTEWYLPVSNLGKMKLSDFHVYENGVEYANEGRRWDVDRSLEKKAGRCGIVEKSGNDVELCWGQGSYGDHVWTCCYHLDGLVQSLEDYDAFLHQFVNPGLVAVPQRARLVISNNTGSQQWTSENTRVWGFGFEGDIDVLAGSVVAELSGRMESMIVMVRFDKGMFSPVLSRDITFEEMKDKAFKRSSYDDDGFDFWALFMILLFILPTVGLSIYAIVASMLGYKYKKSMFGQSKITDWYREAPLEGNIPANWYVLTKGNRFSVPVKPENLVGTYFLKWILEGSLVVKTVSGRWSDTTTLTFTEKVPDFTCAEEQFLFSWAAAAAGDDVLESSEFKRWSKKNSAKLVKWPDQIQNAGYAWLVDRQYISGLGKGREDHQQDLRNVIAFKNFLNDFTLSKEREARDVSLWKSYLIFAQMFGIADKVAGQFESLYPEFFQEVAQTSGMDAVELMRVIRWNQAVSTSGYSTALAKQQAAASGGYGGHTSFGGGGGFSGGGFGGGSR